MAEQKQDDLLEEAGADENAEESTEQKKALSTSLILKIAIGLLAVILIALIVTFFFFPLSDEQADNIETELTQEESSGSENNANSEDTAADETETIELPPINEAESPSSDNAVAPDGVNAEPNQNAADNAAIPADKILSELLAIQEQLTTLKQEKETLTKQVQQLTRENQALKSGTALPASDTSGLVVEQEPVLSDEIPPYYQQNNYANTPQPSLDPKWGSTEAPTTNN